MNIADKVHEITSNMQLDEKSKRFYQEYVNMVEEGHIKPKGYNLAGVDVIGIKKPTSSLYSINRK